MLARMRSRPGLRLLPELPAAAAAVPRGVWVAACSDCHAVWSLLWQQQLWQVHCHPTGWRWLAAAAAKREGQGAC